MTLSYSIKPPFEPSILYELFLYDPNIGTFVRKTSRGGQKVGTEAGYTRSDGYTYIRIQNKQYLGHLLAWYYHYKEWPKTQLDHINGIKNDNRISNLRDVLQSINQQNQLRAPITNKSTGVLGVSKTASGKFNVRITLPGSIRKSVGTFSTLEEASEAYKTAKREAFPDSYIDPQL